MRFLTPNSFHETNPSESLIDMLNHFRNQSKKFGLLVSLSANNTKKKIKTEVTTGTFLLIYTLFTHLD